MFLLDDFKLRGRQRWSVRLAGGWVHPPGFCGRTGRVERQSSLFTGQSRWRARSDNMSILHMVAGGCLRDRLRRSVAWLKLAASHWGVRRGGLDICYGCPLDGSLERCSRWQALGRPGTASEYYQKSLGTYLWWGKSGNRCLECCLRNTFTDERKMGQVFGGDWKKVQNETSFLNPKLGLSEQLHLVKKASSASNGWRSWRHGRLACYRSGWTF